MKKRYSWLLSASAVTLGVLCANNTTYADETATTTPQTEVKAEEKQAEAATTPSASGQDRSSTDSQASEENETASSDEGHATNYAAPEKEDYQDKVQAEYSAEVAHSGYSVDALPWKVNREKTINLGTSKDLINKKVKVLNEDQDGYYAEIEDENGNYKGWIDTRAFARKRVKSYDTQIIAGGFSVDSKPWGEAGKINRGMTDDYVGQTVRVVMHNDRDLYFQALLNGKELGWIDYRAFASSYVQSTERVYKGGFVIKQAGQVVANTSDYFGETARVYRLKRNKNVTFVKINNRVSGFVSGGAVDKDDQTYDVYVISSKYALDNRPWNEHGKTNLGQSSDLLYQKVRVYNTNAAKTYYLVGDQSGKMYWVDYRALSKTTGPSLIVRKKGFSLDSEPWSTHQGIQLGTTDKILNERVVLLGKNDSQLYYFVRQASGAVSWVDYRAFSEPGLASGTWRLQDGVLYARNNRYNVGSNFIAVDIDNQRLWGVKNGRIIVDTPVITGAPGSDTPRGHFSIQPYKQSPTVLVGPGYASPVKYWIPFKGNMWGIHDSDWQHNGYGGNLYRRGYGSHGCINTPLGSVSNLYRNFAIGAHVVVY